MKIFIDYILPFLLLMVVELLYFKVARYYRIIDVPNARSSHQVPTIRGGGIIFIFAAILFYFSYGFNFSYLLVALLISGVTSFTDDVRSLPTWLRFFSHLISVFLIFRQCDMLTVISFPVLAGIAVLFIGVINAYNFMDGINGLTGLYSLALIIPLYFTEQNETLQSLELVTAIGLIVFNFFNTRTKAVCFAGDVGSICMAILILFMLTLRIQETKNFIYVGMLLVYGMDSVFTILQRLMQKENIFKPHRKHLYQYLSNEKKIPQLLVSMMYAGLQLIINLLIVTNDINYWGLLIITLILSSLYWYFKAPYILLSRI